MAHGEAKTSLRCYVMGEQSLLIHCAEALLERGHSVAGVIAKDARIVEWARSRGLHVVDPKSDLYAELSREPFDHFFSITNLSIVPEPVLALAKRGSINFHDGPLPRYAGLHVPAWAILRGEATHGISWHLMEGGVDEGDVLAERVFAIAPRETSYTINTRCYEAGMESFAALVDELGRGEVPRRKQDLSSRGYFGKHARVPGAGFLDWSRPAAELDALVRALDFGPTDNPVGCAKLALATAGGFDPRAEGPEGRGRVRAVTSTLVHAASLDPSAAPGTIVALGESLRVATGAGDLEILATRKLDGALSLPGACARALGLGEGSVLTSLDASARAALQAVDERLAKNDAFWLKRLAKRNPAELPSLEPKREGERTLGRRVTTLPRPVTSAAQPALAAAALAAGFVARVSDKLELDLGYASEATRRSTEGAESCFASQLPLALALTSDSTVAQLEAAVAAEIEAIDKRGGYGLDLPWRRRAPELASRPHRVVLEIGREREGSLPEGADLALLVAPDGSELGWLYDHRSLGEEAAASLADRFAAFVEGAASAPDTKLSEVPLLTEAERHRLLVTWNDTTRPYERELCVHQAFAQQAARTPDAVAVVFEGVELSYRELDARTNRLARHLQSLGVGPDVRVGVSVERSLDMMIAILGVQKAGGAYVPMDPSYPADRIAFMLEDAQAPVLVTQAALVEKLPPHGAKTVRIDADWTSIEALSSDAVPSPVGPEHLAYVIYTSGSTGKPKGVMVEHRNVLNFFAGMDARIPHDEPGVWLAVTSLSFDISVLELFWTLARGFTVVLYRDRTAEAAQAPRRGHKRPLEFSLFYFASDEGETVADKYRLLMEGARFADQSGFVAVWTPERHFHAFGGLYPNPSVASAALAMITERVQLRAGSCVLPLHPPTRVVEEWSLVDNLSKGRVGIAFASGWQPNDFVIAPEKFADRKNIMFRDIETVRRLWRGESVTMKSPLGKDVEVRTMPRPVQKELPIWITAAGNPETFEEAGRIGANVLTHLLGQTFEEVAKKNEIYRKAWRDAGHPGRGTITLMLHTFVGHDDDEVKETVRAPMKGYLKSAVNLVKQAAWTFPTFKQRADEKGMTPADVFEKEELSAEDLEALLDHAFERYFRTSGLFGTPEACAEIANKLREIDVDEVGCLMDYGVPSAMIMEHMPLLADVKRIANASIGEGDAPDHSLAAQLARHRVTHLQCTPSMLGMILGDPEARAALSSLECVMIGGEAFPLALASDLRRATQARILNMYGPTETTIWSSVDAVDPSEGSITIGRPLANQQVYVLDPNRQPVPPGMPGELYIGGEGVVRGYLHRPELTSERFVPDPFSKTPGARLYRTGDLVRWGHDGRVVFLGRLDHQVKIRGYRIELGEIEAAMLAYPGVREAVVIAREDSPGDKRLVGYLSEKPGEKVVPAELKSALRERLPEYMVPSQIAVLPALPLTPNAKIDRKALPAPETVQSLPAADYVAPASELEQQIAHIWSDLLHVERVGLEDNFFDLGGHSLLAVQAHRRIRDEAKRELSLTDLFRFPTIKSLVGFLDGGAGGGADLAKSANRAEARRESMNRRQELLARRRGTKES